MQAWIHRERKGEHTLQKNALKSWNKDLWSPVKLQVKWKLIGEAPSRKGEPCLKILYGKSQPRNEMLAFSFDTVSSDLTWVLSALQCDPRAQVQKCPIWGKVLPPSSFHCLLQVFAKDFKIRSPLQTKPFHLWAFHTFHVDRFQVSAHRSWIQIHIPTDIWSRTLGINWVTNCKVRDISSSKVFCVLCCLFSSKTQDVHTDYFACISVLFYSSCQRNMCCILWLKILFFFFFFFPSALCPYFSILWHCISCMFTGGNEWVRGHCSSPHKDYSNTTTIAILI